MLISTEVYLYIPLHYIYTFKTNVVFKLQIHRILTAVMLGVIMLFPDLINGTDVYLKGLASYLFH